MCPQRLKRKARANNNKQQVSGRDKPGVAKNANLLGPILPNLDFSTDSFGVTQVKNLLIKNNIKCQESYTSHSRCWKQFTSTSIGQCDTRKLATNAQRKKRMPLLGISGVPFVPVMYNLLMSPVGKITQGCGDGKFRIQSCGAKVQTLQKRSLAPMEY